MNSKNKQFDPQTLYCVIQGRLNVGEDPKSIFEELKDLPVVDIDSLRLLLKEIKKQEGRYLHSKARAERNKINNTDNNEGKC